MEEGRSISELFDASAYMLFEASGDSDDQSQCYYDQNDSVLMEHRLDQSDDAQSSCSYGSESDRDHSTTAIVHEINDEDDDDDASGDHDDDFNYGSNFNGDCSNGDEEDGVVDQCLVKEKMKKSKVLNYDYNNGDNSNERDKLFWEACLAS